MKVDRVAFGGFKGEEAMKMGRKKVEGSRQRGETIQRFREGNHIFYSNIFASLISRDARRMYSLQHSLTEETKKTETKVTKERNPDF